MRASLYTLCLIAVLTFSIPAQAQLRSAGSAAESSVRLYDVGATGFSLNRFFTPENFQMSHSFEVSSFGGSTLSMYTNSMRWRFSDKLAARLDVSAAYSPLDNQRSTSVTRGNNGQVFLRNAEIVYRPSKNTLLNFSFGRSPYGSYARPYGYSGYSRYGGSSFRADFGPSGRDLFWNERH